MKRLRAWFLAPTWTVMLSLFAAPLAIILAYSFLTRGTWGGISRPWSIESYQRLADPIYLGILWRSFWIAGAATVLCLVLGFPLALFISRAGSRKNLYLSLVILPFWTSFLVRTYAWMFLLRDTGLINTALQKLGVIHNPLPLLYNDGAVILGLAYGYLPFMVLPLYATLERLDRNLLEAAADLGAKPWVALTRIVIPLSAPGIRAGAILVFIPCLGAYLTPDLLGGGKTVMIGNLIQNQFTTARDWPFGSAVSLTLMAIVLVLLLVFVRRQEGGLV
ncbi:MAG TPA: ABC transporter permease [Bryobacteraceae bacterium]|jgi:spermidine/putrescine transport system permease protein|nr:ABC transporter permease [Bryobacteraceae bacterium]